MDQGLIASAMATTERTLIHRDEALNLMEGRGAILDTARQVSAMLGEAGLSAAVIGGIAVVLHGHWRATRDIDLLVASPLEEVGKVLDSHGFRLDSTRREFVRDAIPVHLVLPEQTGTSVLRTIEIEGIVTVPLEDLICMKLRSGTRNLLRAQDLADVIGLIRHHKLTGEFARLLENSLRPAFRKLVRKIEREG
jgi:hypothetical protein